MSTADFLNSLRQGDYGSALDWPHFLLAKYSSNKPLGGDGLLTLAIYELINSELSQNDLKFIEMLYAFLNTFTLPAEKAYAGIVIISAAMQYYVYQEKGLLNFFKNKQLTDAAMIETWMSRDNPAFNTQTNNTYLAEKTLFLEQKLPEYTKLMKEIEEGILLINYYKGLCLEYIQLLLNLPEEEKTTKTGMRLGIAQSLYDYLCQRIIFKPALKKEISSYLDKIRAEQEPSLILKREEVYLKKIEDKNTFKRIYDHSKYCLGFFTKNVITTLFAFKLDEKSKKQASKNSTP